MAQNILIHIQKGGSGKTATAIELSRALSLKGYKVLLVDTDQQANATKALIPNTEYYQNEYYALEHFLVGSCKFEETIIRYEDLRPEEQAITSLPFDVVMATKALMNADGALVDKNSIFLLRDGLKSVDNKYDYIIIDSQPSVGLLPYSAMIAADKIIIPIDPDVSTFDCLPDMNLQIMDIQREYNPNLKIAGLLLVRFNFRTNLNKKIYEMAKMSATFMKTKLFDTYINEGNSIKVARAGHMSIQDYDPKSKPAIDYMSFTEEFLKS